ncbi:MAG: DUF2085 domain-containing protein [Anaerolineales bacterium]|nr:DUF2085 domain-containing protein [Anaerolineales bacterium]
MSTINSLIPPPRFGRFTDRLNYRLSQYWLLGFSLVFGLYVGLPFLAPVFMQIGWHIPGKAIYFIYSFLCHQLPQRSFFLFGPQTMYSLGELQASLPNTTNLLILRQFIGNPDMGWKVAWSDRMVSMYVSILILGWLWWSLRRRIKQLPLWGFVLLLLPMAIDGSSHMISDLAGFGQGFRYTNTWLAELTGNVFSRSFYVGNALGSFNSWMRLLTGILFGLGIVWIGFPYLEKLFMDTARTLKSKPQHPDF